MVIKEKKTLLLRKSMKKSGIEEGRKKGKKKQLIYREGEESEE